MGEDEMAVVDSHTRVHGISGLRVVDSSIFPSITNGNLNSPTIMLAERAADLIKGKTPLKPLEASIGLFEDWRTRQRQTNIADAIISCAIRTPTATESYSMTAHSFTKWKGT